MRCLAIDLTQSCFHAMYICIMVKTKKNQNNAFKNYDQVLGFKVLEWTDGNSLIAAPIDLKLRNRGRSIHGGVIASLIKIAGTMAGNSTAKGIRKTQIINLNVNFISGTKANLVHVRGRRTHSTKGTLFSDIEIFDPETGVLIANGQAVFKLLRPNVKKTVND